MKRIVGTFFAAVLLLLSIGLECRAGQFTLSLGTPAIIGMSEDGSAFLRVDLPQDLSTQIAGRVEEAVLDLTIGWGRGGLSLVALPVSGGLVDSLPASDIAIAQGMARLLGVASPTIVRAGSTRCSMSVRNLVSGIRGGTVSERTVLIGLLGVDEGVTRWPVGAITNIEETPERWECAIRIRSAASMPD